MKKIVSTLAVFLVASLGINAQKMEYKNLKEGILDYGIVKQNSDGNRTVEVKNTGDKPLIIANVQPTCGCTIADWTKTPIKPGGKGTITIHYNTSIVGNFTKQINVTTNDPKEPSGYIKMKGTVEAVPPSTAVASTPAVKK